MAAYGNLSVILLYEPDSAKGRPVSVARVTANEPLLLEAARAAIVQAQARADALTARDEVLGECEREEVKRLQGVLQILLPALALDEAALKAAAKSKQPGQVLM